MSDSLIQSIRLSSLVSFVLLTITIVFSGCRQSSQLSYVSMNGETMGTYYSITAEIREPVQQHIEDLLRDFNAIFSTYDPNSVISDLNASNASSYTLYDGQGQFRRVLESADEAYRNTDGHFDITVMPLVRFWGFSSEMNRPEEVRESVIDSLLSMTGMDQVSWQVIGDSLTIMRNKPDIQLDVNALAKGYGVDLIGIYLEDLGVAHYMVEIGGEVRCRGVNARGAKWTIAVDKPIPGLEEREFQALVQLDNQSMASSGNYRNFYFKDDQLIGHTINPKTGYPEQNDLLAVSVITDDCMDADALATGFMALGFNRSIAIAEQLENVESLFLRMDGAGEIIEDKTSGFNIYDPSDAH